MARKRASMREGPLAELFKATEAAQRQADRQAEPEQPAPAEPSEETVEHVPEFARPAPERPTWEDAAKPEPRVPEPEPAPEPPRPAASIEQRRMLAPVPEPPPRLERAPRTDTAAYLAVIRVVGVGGAGLNA